MRIYENWGSEVSLYDLANMAEDVYELHSKSRISQKPPRGWMLTDDQYQQPHYSGGYPKRLAMAVYIDDNENMVLALKGTDIGSASDCHADFSGLVRGEVPEGPIKAACKVLKEWQVEGYNIMVTGHSLAGYMAETLASHLGISGAAFCAPG